MLELISRITAIRDLSLLERISPAWMDPNGSVNTASLRFVQHWYLERGDLTSEVDVDQIVDPSFADYALSRIGRYPTP